MKLRVTLSALLGSALMGGCGTVEMFEGQQVRCSDRTVRVNHRMADRAASIRARPNVIEICRNYTLTIVSRPPVGRDAMRSVQDPSAPAPARWLTAPSDESGVITIRVPGDAVSGEYKYTIEVDGVGIIDPVARIIP